MIAAGTNRLGENVVGQLDALNTAPVLHAKQPPVNEKLEFARSDVRLHEGRLTRHAVAEPQICQQFIFNVGAKLRRHVSHASLIEIRQNLPPGSRKQLRRDPGQIELAPPVIQFPAYQAEQKRFDFHVLEISRRETVVAWFFPGRGHEPHDGLRDAGLQQMISGPFDDLDRVETRHAIEPRSITHDAAHAGAQAFELGQVIFPQAQHDLAGRLVVIKS